jgi:hypothetical protein
MRKILFGVIITLVILFTFKYCGERREEKIVLQENSALIQEQIKNVGKLVVTEGHFSEVFTYQNSKAIFGDWLEADFLNQFEAKDYNEIKKAVNESLMRKIESSDLKSNAKNRLVSELAKFYILTNSLGWTLEYNETPISSPEKLQTINLKL